YPVIIVVDQRLAVTVGAACSVGGILDVSGRVRVVVYAAVRAPGRRQPVQPIVRKCLVVGRSDIIGDRPDISIVVIAVDEILNLPASRSRGGHLVQPAVVV